MGVGGSNPSAGTIIETHTDPPCYLGSQRVTAYGLFKCVSIMGAVVGYGVALQVACLEGFDSLGLHQVYAWLVFNGLALLASTQ